MPRIVDHEARRAEIAQAFFRVILRKGIEGATTREIAQEAGVSLGVLAHYFDGKEALVLAAFDVLVSQFSARLTAAAQSQSTPLAALEAVCLQTLPLDEPRRLESGAWLSFWAHGYADAAARKRQRDEYDTWTATLAGLIRRLPSAPGPTKAREAAVELAALLDGLTVQLVLRGPETFAPRQAERAVRRWLERLA